ncbi:MAG TPA: hypothetical protein VHQ64_03640 [Pyrinomonadaceae bacterium]|jgi:hypothetical protein|nr:hypothetical protein [Pyrinomonadaceae bacterium]
MKNTVGLWIDHSKAVIVSLAGNDANIELITSDIESQHRQSGVATPADDMLQTDMTGRLNRFYDDVISCVRGADEIFILGPGEAKGELRTRLEKSYLGRRIVGVEACDKMTDPQIVAKVREHLLDRLAS